MAVLNLSLDRYKMNVPEVSAAMGEISKLVQVMGEYNSFMVRKVEGVNDRFAGRNYDRIMGALGECQKKLNESQQELNDLLTSCNKLVDKINLIEG